ncbi:hypothetical protein Q3P76_004132 [Salmonella enterica]|nr:hypothetical protein [Salmonella enterica]EKM6811536.1 hypothetical protein [Salmonella enterica]ELM4635271.1 hypothetical protein [Salmonella enterica]
MINDEQRELLNRLNKIAEPMKRLSEPCSPLTKHLNILKPVSGSFSGSIIEHKTITMCDNKNVSLNEIILVFRKLVKENTIFSPKCCKYIIDILNNVTGRGDLFKVYDFLYVYAEAEFKNAIKNILNEIKNNTQYVSFNQKIVTYNKLCDDIKHTAREIDFSLTDIEAGNLAGYFFFIHSNNNENAKASLMLVERSIIERVFIVPYKNIIIDFIRENINIIIQREKAQKQNIRHKKTRVNKNNQDVYMEVLRITEATLQVYPNVSTYALISKFERYFSGRKSVSYGTLRRWIEGYRKSTGKVARGTHTGFFHLIVE